MSLSITIRQATSSDNILLAQLGSITFEQAFAKDNTPEDMAAYLQSAFTPEIQAEELADPQCVFWIVLLGDAIIGYVKLHSGAPSACISKVKALKISRLYLLQDWWGKGLGHQVIDKIIDYAQVNKFEALWLTVWEHNPGAIKLYQKFGFVVVGDEDFILGQDVQHDFIMEKIV